MRAAIANATWLTDERSAIFLARETGVYVV